MNEKDYFKKLEEYDKEVNRLFQENKKLKECYCNRTDCSGRIKDSKKYESLQQRIDKAIEYIEENTTDPEFVVSGELQENQVIELLKILK